MHAEERETSITYSDADDQVVIFTCIRKDITALKKKEQFTLTEEGKYKDGTAHATFTIPRDRFNIAGAARTTRALSDEQRKAQGERLAAARQKRLEEDTSE